jgi:UDP-N-acetylglucosamine 4-epimerase
MYNIPYHGEQDLSNLNFLVTGGAGFIGSNLVEYLLKFGAGKVRVLDNFSTGDIKNLENFNLYNSFELITGDIRNMEDCIKAVNGIHIVFHEAALGSVPRSIEDPITTNDVNIKGFLNMLIASKDAGVKRLVYAASSSTYGDNNDLPKIESNIGRPLSPYAVTKYVNELYADVYSRLYDLEYIGLRYFNVFGPKQKPDGAYAAVIPKFISSLLAHKEPTINGDGKNSRDFTYIENVVQANIISALTDKKMAVNQVYNVAYGEQTSLNELAILLRDSLAAIDPEIADINFHYGKERAGDIPHSLASIAKAKHLLNYFPYFSIKDGLEVTVKSYTEDYSKVAVAAY